jgi:hypothetical protein
MVIVLHSEYNKGDQQQFTNSLSILLKILPSVSYKMCLINTNFIV